MEDREILELFRQRDQRAIPALEERYGGRLRALSLRLLGSPEDAEECVSGNFCRRRGFGNERTGFV